MLSAEGDVGKLSGWSAGALIVTADGLLDGTKAAAGSKAEHSTDPDADPAEVNSETDHEQSHVHGKPLVDGGTAEPPGGVPGDPQDMDAVAELQQAVDKARLRAEGHRPKRLLEQAVGGNLQGNPERYQLEDVASVLGCDVAGQQVSGPADHG